MNLLLGYWSPAPCGGVWGIQKYRGRSQFQTLIQSSEQVAIVVGCVTLGNWSLGVYRGKEFESKDFRPITDNRDGPKDA